MTDRELIEQAYSESLEGPLDTESPNERGIAMFEKVATKIVLWLIKKCLPGKHLHNNPQKVRSDAQKEA